MGASSFLNNYFFYIYSNLRCVSELFLKFSVSTADMHHLSLYQLVTLSILPSFFEASNLATSALKCSHFILFSSQDFPVVDFHW